MCSLWQNNIDLHYILFVKTRHIASWKAFTILYFFIHVPWVHLINVVPCGFYWTCLLCVCGLKWLLHNYHSGLLIFRMVVEPQNSGKSTKSPQNPQKHKNRSIWNLFQLLGLFNCRKHANLIILKLCQCNKQTTSQLLPGKDYVVNNWVLDVYNQ